MGLHVVLYAIAVLCFLIAGVVDIVTGEYRPGVIALLFAAANALIFLWRGGAGA